MFSLSAGGTMILHGYNNNLQYFYVQDICHCQQRCNKHLAYVQPFSRWHYDRLLHGYNNNLQYFYVQDICHCQQRCNKHLAYVQPFSRWHYDTAWL